MIRVYYDSSSTPVDIDRDKPEGSNENETSNYFAFKQPSLRLFNNILIDVRCNNDHIESLKAIAESFYAAAKSSNPNVIFDDNMLKFEKSKSKPIPTQWLFQININTLYENVMLSSSLSALNDDDDEMLNLVDEQCDTLESYEHLSADDYPQEIIYHEKEELKSMSNIDYIKQSLNKVKDKVKIPYWKDRFSTFSSKNVPLIKLPQDTNTDKPEDIEINDEYLKANVVLRKGSLDIRLQSNNEMFEILHSSKHKDAEQFLSASRSRLGSSSDDESTRRQPRTQHFDFKMKKSKSGVLSLSSDFHSNLDDLENDQSSNEDDGCGILSGYRNVLENIANPNNQGKILATDEKKSLVQYAFQSQLKYQDPSLLSKFYSSENDLNKLLKYYEESVKLPKDANIFLKSCGMLIGCAQNPSVPLIPHGKVQLAAVTGGAYQRRAERISLQLSIDETLVDSKISLSFAKSPHLSSQQKFKQICQQSFKQSRVSEPSPIPSLSDDNSETHNMISYIQMPSVEVRNPKVVERLTMKQIDYAMFIEELRKKTLGIHEPLVTGMIIF